MSQFSPNIRESAFKSIEDNLDTGLFYDYLLDVFVKIKSEFDTIQEKIESLNEELRLLELAEGDPLRDEYRQEIRNVIGVRKSINNRNTLEHLTNVGILPNYAFPETGVQLNAHVRSIAGEGSTQPEIDRPPYEVVRPASQAIKELAPENFFYTQGYRFEISGLNTFDWGDEKNFHVKRFCSKCDHIEKSSLAATGNCPKCGDSSWSSSSNTHSFVKLTSVRSYNISSRAVIDDLNDERDRQHYQILNHVSFDAESSEGAWILKDLPFGIEFVRNATITTVNYGRDDSNDARKLRINDTEVMTKGFVTCKHCGMSVSATHLHKTAEDFHYGYCKYRDKKYGANDTEGVFEELYLFREIQTEVLKIILPVQEFNTEADVRMFQAGLELGLKKYFKGNPGHIRIMNYREYNQKTSRFDRFLLLYDTIPGGSGYLEELFTNLHFNKLLENSYHAIRDCTCQRYGHDGCYKCIYSYGNQYKREGVSRERAEEWFGKIYNRLGEWERSTLGLTSVTNTGRIEESELEERFIKLLRQWCNEQDGFSFEERKEHGIVHYRLSVRKNDVNAEYNISPQVTLGPRDDIEYSTRTDFLISCTQFLFKDEEYKTEVPKIALYMDGYQFHASSQHNVLEKDITIRTAIAAHSGYKVWTLTWQDLDYFENYMHGEKHAADSLAKMYAYNFSDNYMRKLLPNLTAHAFKINFALSLSNVFRLLDRFIYPLITPFFAFILYVFIFLDRKGFNSIF